MPRTDTPTIRLRPPGPPAPCGRCGTSATAEDSPTGLVGWHDGKPPCPACLSDEAPALGRAWTLAERAAKATGTWPTETDDWPLATLFELLQGVRRGLGSIRPENPRLTLALAFLETLARHDAAHRPERNHER